MPPRTQVQDLINSACQAANPTKAGCLWAGLEILRIAERHVEPGSSELLRIMLARATFRMWHNQSRDARILFASALEQAELHGNEKLCSQIREQLHLIQAD